MVFCPECGSQRIWKDGIRRIKSGGVQRWLCRSCGYRFSESQVKVNIRRKLPILPKSVHNFGDFNGVNVFPANMGLKDSPFSTGKDVGSHGFSVVGKTINTFLPNSREHQVCASESVAKNLSQQRTRQKRAAGATKLSKEEIKGKIVEYMWHLKRQGYREGTIERWTQLITRLVKLGANLWNPKSVKEIMANQETWGLGTKDIVRQAYSNFVEMEGISWQPPKYRIPERLPFIPLEKEIDLLINACGKSVSIFLEGLKETGADPGELLAAEWIDLNEKTRTIAINHPVKGHNARILPLSKDLIARLQLLPKRSQRIFSTTMNSMYTNFWQQRKRIAHSFNNPRIEKTTFTSIRHWKATTEYHKTKDILHVKHLLGHKSLNSTMIYIDIERAVYGEYQDDEFTVRVAKTLEEDQELLEAGFEYVTDRDGAKIYRKRK